MEPEPSDPELEAAIDDELVARRLAGDCEAFGVLWDRYHLRIYVFAYRRLRDREQAEDATAETFRRALAKLATYRGNGFRPWIFAIARNVVFDELRARRRVAAWEDATDLDCGPAIDEMAVARAEAGLVSDLLPRLPQVQREVVELRLAGLAPREIAQVLGKERPAVDMAYHRALERLRVLLGITGGPSGEFRHE